MNKFNKYLSPFTINNDGERIAKNDQLTGQSGFDSSVKKPNLSITPRVNNGEFIGYWFNLERIEISSIAFDSNNRFFFMVEGKSNFARILTNVRKLHKYILERPSLTPSEISNLTIINGQIYNNN